MSTNPFVGTWVYRSFRNSPKLIEGDAERLLALLFDEALLTIEAEWPWTIKGHLDTREGDRFRLSGTVVFGSPFSASFSCTSIERSDNEYLYTYTAYLVPPIPNGDGSMDTMVGSVVRSARLDSDLPHEKTVASFIAVRKP